MFILLLISTYRMDQSAMGHDYVAKLEKHESQRDYSTGFGGKFGVQTDRKDKVSVAYRCEKLLYGEQSLMSIIPPLWFSILSFQGPARFQFKYM